MARIPQVTRTLVTTVCDVMCLDVTSGNTFVEKVRLPRTYKDEKKLMKKLKEVMDTDAVKAVYVVSSYVDKTLYGMTEEDFVKYAEALPPRETVKAEN